MSNKVFVTECPRDAMQGIKEFIPTELKIKYLQQLLSVGFDYLDFGSFVSAKAIPQMQDTSKVLEGLDISKSSSKLLAIIANTRGAEDALQYEKVSYLGFPLSVSETFQQRNTNASIQDALQRVEEIQNLCVKTNTKLRVYLSMAFGNPYNEEWRVDKVVALAEQLNKLGIQDIALADTIGCSDTENITYLFTNLIKEFSSVKWIAHLHSTPDKSKEKIEAAIKSGCTYFDSAIMGFGGCPMAKDDLTGNIATEKLIDVIQAKKLEISINTDALKQAQTTALEIFNAYH